jgi:aryl-alcohol dehydrogenase-like predicted oxidoreductase
MIFFGLAKSADILETATNSPSLAVPKFQGEKFYANKRIVDEIKKLAARKGCTLPQVALAWVLAQGMIPIPGTTKAKRLEENWKSRDIELTEEGKRNFRKILENAKVVGNRYNEALQALVGN